MSQIRFIILMAILALTLAGMGVVQTKANIVMGLIP